MGKAQESNVAIQLTSRPSASLRAVMTAAKRQRAMQVCSNRESYCFFEMWSKASFLEKIGPTSLVSRGRRWLLLVLSRRQTETALVDASRPSA